MQKRISRVAIITAVIKEKVLMVFLVGTGCGIGEAGSITFLETDFLDRFFCLCITASGSVCVRMQL